MLFAYLLETHVVRIKESNFWTQFFQEPPLLTVLVLIPLFGFLLPSREGNTISFFSEPGAVQVLFPRLVIQYYH